MLCTQWLKERQKLISSCSGLMQIYKLYKEAPLFTAPLLLCTTRWFLSAVCSSSLVLSPFQFCLLSSNLISLLPCLWPIFSLYLLQLSSSLMADGVWLLCWAWLLQIWGGEEEALWCLISHLMMKSARSMSLPHLLCRRMPPLPTTAHFFKGSCRGLSCTEDKHAGLLVNNHLDTHIQSHVHTQTKTKQ